MNILVTGATGFIGGAIAQEAASRGWKVFGLHRNTSKTDGSDKKQIEWRTLEELERSSESFDIVVHAAALRHRHGIAAGEYERTNSELTSRIVRLAQSQKQPLTRFVLVSSIAVYGWPARLPIDEAFPHDPVAEYGRSKVRCEQVVRLSGLPFTIVEPSITYGPGDTNGMMDKILRMISKRRFVAPGMGRSRVQLVYIDDLARLSIDASVAQKTLSQAFICTYKEPIQLRDLVRLSSSAVGTWVPSVGPPIKLLRLGALALDTLDSFGVFKGEPPLTREKLATVTVDRAYKIDKMRELLGDEPHIGYEEGIRRTATALGLAK